MDSSFFKVVCNEKKLKNLIIITTTFPSPETLPEPVKCWYIPKKFDDVCRIPKNVGNGEVRIIRKIAKDFVVPKNIVFTEKNMLSWNVPKQFGN